MSKCSIFRRLLCIYKKKNCCKDTLNYNFKEEPKLITEPPKYVLNSKGRWIDSKTGKFVKKSVALGETNERL